MTLSILPFSTPKQLLHSSCSFWWSSHWPSPHQRRIRRSARMSTWAIGGIYLDGVNRVHSSVLITPGTKHIRYVLWHIDTKLQRRLRSPKIKVTNSDVITGLHMGWVRLVCSTGLGPQQDSQRWSPIRALQRVGLLQATGLRSWNSSLLELRLLNAWGNSQTIYIYIYIIDSCIFMHSWECLQIRCHFLEQKRAI